MPNYIKAPRKGCFYIIKVQSALEESSTLAPLLFRAKVVCNQITKAPAKGAGMPAQL